MTITDINDLQDEVKQAQYIVIQLEKLKKEGIHGEFKGENFTEDYMAFKGYGFKRDSEVGAAVLSSMKFDWDVFDIHLINARKHLIEVTKQLQIVNGHLNNIRIKD